MHLQLDICLLTNFRRAEFLCCQILIEKFFELVSWLFQEHRTTSTVRQTHYGLSTAILRESSIKVSRNYQLN